MENYIIKDELVFVPATKWFEERAIGELKEQNQQYTIASMEERFHELVDKVKEIRTEFDAATDKIKLAGKITRTKSYICNAKAIGNYAELLEQMDVMEVAIKVDVEKALAKKEELVLVAEELLTKKEWKVGTEKLRLLQAELKALPIVPDLKNEELRERFEKVKEEFFKIKQASFENFEHELLDNLSKKIDLCEKAESLSNSVEWKKTTDAYMAMNEEWKKIGMVPKHRMEEIWFRFCAAKDIFFARKKEHIGDITTEQEANLILKLELIANAEVLKESTAWNKTSEEYKNLMEAWKKIGRVPAEKSDEVWHQFLAAKNHFYKNKDTHYASIKVQLEDNYAKKTAITVHAETLQNSFDFDNASQEFLDMFEEWKKIGRTPTEYGDDLWERFMKAKRTFFEKKDAHRDERRKEQTKDLQERLSRNRNYLNRITKDVKNEEDLLFDVHERMNNLPANLRSYEKKEEYADMIKEIEIKVNELKEKANEIKEKVAHDEREMSKYYRGSGAKSSNAKDGGEHKKNGESKVTDKPTASEEKKSREPQTISQTQVETKHEPEEELSEVDALQKLLNKYKK
jgi:hypothetical protein